MNCAHLELECEFHAIRAQGPGGQHVNKASTAIHLRFNVAASSLPPETKAKLLALPRSKVSGEGVIVIKAQGTRSQELNRASALQRLQALIDTAQEVQTVRKPTKPTFGSKQRRLSSKTQRGEIKAARGKVQL
jgi:ribosome-associated protein